MYLFLAFFIAGLLLAVRLMFFGAERARRSEGALPLRRWEPALVAFLVMLGLAGYLLTEKAGMALATGTVAAALLALAFAAIATRLAIAAARIQPEHDPDDPRFVHQGRVGVATVAIPESGQGVIRFGEAGAETEVPAREISGESVAAGEEICIDRVEDGVAFVERWAEVEARL